MTSKILLLSLFMASTTFVYPMLKDHLTIRQWQPHEGLDFIQWGNEQRTFAANVTILNPVEPPYRQSFVISYGPDTTFTHLKKNLLRVTGMYSNSCTGIFVRNHELIQNADLNTRLWDHVSPNDAFPNICISYNTTVLSNKPDSGCAL